MKLVLYMSSGLPHHKNWIGIQRMCNAYSITFEYTNSIERLKIPDYDILYCMCNVIDPYIVPQHIKILYGPQLWVIPEPPMVGPYDPNLENRCVFNLLSKWVKEYAQEMAPNYIMPISHFPMAVDIDYFSPKECAKEYDCLVYIKRRSHELIQYTLSLLDQKGLKYKLLKYGSYSEPEYMESLHKSKFMLTLDAHESQGFALQEAMSCNIPLLVMDATSMYDETDNGYIFTYSHLQPKKLLATSVPYWSDACGIKITNKEDMSMAIDRMMTEYTQFTPREYVLQTLSDKVCMKRILDYFGLSV